ncbi:MAG TPA: hypothetical protein VMF58_04915 [Rhizomicrobium sp.]|nr:hypothetical protein [Rhizomicrobium sp.]
MSKQQPIELFMPPNMLKAKVGSSHGAIDMAAVMRAEAAMETLKTEFTEWFASDVARLIQCRDAFAAGKDDATLAALGRASVDIKGQATTYEFPMVSRVAASLCRLINAMPSPDALPLNLVDAHVAAIRIIVRDKIMDTTNPMALELIKELTARVTEKIEPAAA